MNENKIDEFDLAACLRRTAAEEDEGEVTASVLEDIATK